jgi:hypothetical protein
MESLEGDIRKYGKELGHGSEAVVYLYQGFAWKIFNRKSQMNHVQLHINFLTSNKNSGVVPCIKSGSTTEGIIQMEYLEDFVTLKKIMRTEQFKDPSWRNSLLEVIFEARLQLPLDIEYVDFKNLSNIMVKRDVRDKPIRAVFIEGGKENKDSGGAFYLFVEMIAHSLSATRCECYKKYLHRK